MKLPTSRLPNPLTGLRDRLRRSPKPEPEPEAPLAPIRPDLPIAVIGDVHGCAALLERLLVKIPAGWPILCVGDIVDRGDNSRQALDILFAKRDVTVLLGNHESMMLDFLRRPLEKGRAWLQYGGLQTLASFGVGGVTVNSRGPRLVEAADSLREAMGPAMVDWIASWPEMRWSGNVIVTHAGADPHRPVDEQEAAVFVWGHPDFMQTRRADGLWVAHGHTIVPEPVAENGRISVDTGAYVTGTLTAALIDNDGVRFITA